MLRGKAGDGFDATTLAVLLHRVKNGVWTQLGVAVGTIGTVSVSYVQDGANNRIKVHDGSADTLRINVVESQIPSGGVALSGQPAILSPARGELRPGKMATQRISR